MEFESFKKLSRLFRDITITEKIDGTNAQIVVTPEGQVLAGSRNRYVTPEDDNYGFARWVYERSDELRTVFGIGRHYGEWWGAGIQRRYNLTHKKFSLFNTARWRDEAKLTLPEGVDVVPVLYKGKFDVNVIQEQLEKLKTLGSVAAPGFMNPEGIVIYHSASGETFKVTLDGDGHKGTK